MNPEAAIDAVASELAWLENEVVFLGGAVIGLYLDAFGRANLRPTEDVDCVVPSADTRAAWWILARELQARGWSPDPEGPICRYHSPCGLVVDLMPVDPEILGFHGRWYRQVVARAQPRALSTGRLVLAPTPEDLLACKLEAFDDGP